MGKIESALLNYDLNSNFTHNELNQAHEKINKNVSKEKTMKNEFDYQILVIFEQLRDMLEDIDLSNNKVFNLPRETAEFYLKEQNKFAVSELLKLISKLAKIPYIQIVNEEADSGIVAFNVEDVFSQDVAYYLNKYNICVRAGNHCAKILKHSTGVKNTVRVSLYFYNTKEEIDSLVELLSNKDKIIKEMI